jgi:hypothetical protein
MVRPRRRGNRLLHLPGLSANPHLPRTRACGYSGSNPASALRSSRSFSPPSSSAPSTSFIYLFPRFVILLRVPFYLLRVSHCIARRSSILLPSPVTRLFVLRVVHLSVSYVRHHVARPFLSPTRTSSVLRVPFYLLLVSHCVARPLSVCLARTSVLLYTAGAEGRNGYQTRWRAGRIKG